jgi:uncharacterized protein
VLQERFFDYWLKGHENGLLDDASLQLAIGRGSGFTWRSEHEWPLAWTQWTHFYLVLEGRYIEKRELPV